ncbi:MAG: ABC transporter permease subunit [Clostridia bacterium]|nr:ABC transporter permease subunit [Clostridia bacterium]
MVLRKNEKRKANIRRDKYVDNLEYVLMSLPGIICVIIFAYIPMFGIIIAFKNFNPNLGVFGSEWNGFDNFKYFFESNMFVRLIRNTVGYNLAFLVINNIANITLAIMLYNVNKKWQLKYYQTTFILPSFMSMVLISYIVYMFLSPSAGFLNKLILLLGGEGVDWYSEPEVWPFVLTFVNMWKGVGMGSLIYYTVLVGIDETLFEAAEIDGANQWEKIKNIIIPSLTSLLCLQIIMGLGHIMSIGMELFYQIPRNQGILYPVTDVISTYTFRMLQTGGDYGINTAIGLFGSVTGTIMVLVSNAVIKKIDEDSSMF